MPDTFRASDLTREHVGRHLRVGEHEGRLDNLYPIDDAFVQLLLVHATEGASIPVVGMGLPVEFLPDPGEGIDSPPG